MYEFFNTYLFPVVVVLPIIVDFTSFQPSRTSNQLNKVKSKDGIKVL